MTGDDRCPVLCPPQPQDSNEHVDTDGDGVGDNADLDDDGDGVADTKDAFPKNPKEHTDTDKDGMGDNQDHFVAQRVLQSVFWRTQPSSRRAHMLGTRTGARPAWWRSNIGGQRVRRSSELNPVVDFARIRAKGWAAYFFPKSTKVVEFGPKSDLGRLRRNSAQRGPGIGKPWPNFGGRKLAGARKLNFCATIYGPNSPDIGRHWSILAVILGQSLGDFGQLWREFDQLRTSFGQLWLTPERFRPLSGEQIGRQIRCDVGHFWPTLAGSDRNST